MPLNFVCALLCVLSTIYVICALELSLDGAWDTHNSNQRINAKSQVPGGIYTDLHRNRIIGEPYYGFNDIVYRWVGNENWTFSRYFDVPAEMLRKSKIVLVAHGIDTACKVSINNRSLGSTVNMFVRYVFNLKDILMETGNQIEVACESPVSYALRQYNIQAKNYPVYPICPPSNQNGNCHINHMRKMQCAFSWDWGPSFPSTGIWKHIGIEAYDGVIIRDVSVATTPQSEEASPWLLKVTAFVETAKPPSSIEGDVDVLLNGEPLGTRPVIIQPDQEGKASMQFTYAVPQRMNIKKWWPNGYGEQNLYTLDVTVSARGETFTKTLRIGFRTVKLLQTPVKNGTGGTEFYFKINDVPIYGKGSNWIPADVLPERVTDEYILHLLRSTQVANMNMLRVWGGGIYESDYFYQTADELGILIWQDFMFAVALYPTNPEFLDTVKTEIRQQVRRLQHHPSVLIWAGNNENEQAISGYWWPGIGIRLSTYKQDYVKLYIETIMPIVLKEDPTRPYVPSSPSNGEETESQGWIAGDPNNVLYGDVHYYNYYSNPWESATYPKARFVSEYGIQSFASRDTFLTAAPAAFLEYPFSMFIDFRQHQAVGNMNNIRFIRDLFNLPTTGNKGRDFDMVVYLSQIVQAQGIKTGVEYFRHLRSILYGDQGHNMGVLYWQLTDIWQAPTWASIEYGGRWKLLQYFARRFFSPLLVVPFINKESFLSAGDLVAYVANDLLQDFPNSVLHITSYSWASFAPVHEFKVNLDVRRERSALAYKSKVNDFMNMTSCTSTKCLFWFTLTDQAGRELGPPNYILPDAPKNIKGLRNATLRITNVRGPFDCDSGLKGFNLTVSTDNIALFVRLDAHNVTGYFSDNGFIMVKPTKALQFTTQEGVTADYLKSVLTIVSLPTTATAGR